MYVFTKSNLHSNNQWQLHHSTSSPEKSRRPAQYEKRVLRCPTPLRNTKGFLIQVIMQLEKRVLGNTPP